MCEKICPGCGSVQEADTEVLEFGATKKASKANNKWQTVHNTFSEPHKCAAQAK